MLVSILLGIFALSICAEAQEPRRDRLMGLLQLETTTEQLDRYGYPKAIFRSYKDTDLSSGTYGIELCVLEMPPIAGRMHVQDIRTDRNIKEVYETALSTTALAVMTGGYFGLNKRGNPIPLGLVKSNGITVSPKHPWKSGGMIAVSNGRAAITSVSALSDFSAYSDVVQSKPMLIENGKDGIRSPGYDHFDRSAVAIDSRSTIYFFVIHEPAGNAASLAEFSKLILGFRPTNGNTITHALAMDGGPGAHMYIPLLNKHCGSGVPAFVPNVLYFSR